MADIFLSYSRADKEIVARLARSLEQEGWSVWWDPAILPHEQYTKVIDREIESARVVLALWSREARESTWVRSEASYALEQKKLVQARLDDSMPPRPFDQVQFADLQDWDGYTRHPQRWALSESVRELVLRSNPSGAPGKKKQQPKQREYRRHRGRVHRWRWVAASAALAGIAGWTIGHYRLRIVVQFVQEDVSELIESNPEGIF